MWIRTQDEEDETAELQDQCKTLFWEIMELEKWHQIIGRHTSDVLSFNTVNTLCVIVNVIVMKNQRHYTRGKPIRAIQSKYKPEGVDYECPICASVGKRRVPSGTHMVLAIRSIMIPHLKSREGGGGEIPQWLFYSIWNCPLLPTMYPLYPTSLPQ